MSYETGMRRFLVFAGAEMLEREQQAAGGAARQLDASGDLGERHGAMLCVETFQHRQSAH